MKSITLHLGQPIPWRSAPTGIAQISELRRSNVELCYLRITSRGAQIRRALISASKAASLLETSPLMFPLENMYDRGVRPKQKVYEISPLPSADELYLRRLAHA